MVTQLEDAFSVDDYPELLVGLNAPDDAAVYKLDTERALISTTDFFPPVVDDPYAFGAIAAANAMSDVYAMGGEVMLAINLVAWPDELDASYLSEILQGGAQKVREAGAVLGGGHTIVDREPKYGLAVTGIVHPDAIIVTGGARPGDLLALTKPLGSGIITTAQKLGQAEAEDAKACVMNMMELNRTAMQAAQAIRPAVHAATDITGFGLLGHAHEMAYLSGCILCFEWDAIPWMPGAHKYAQEMIFPGGTERNMAFYDQWTRFTTGLKNWQRLLLYDSQTSGGLLLAVDRSQGDALMAEMRSRGQPMWIVGEVQEGDPGQLMIR